MALSVVVLPAPLLPMSETISPASTLNEMPFSTSMWPYPTLKFLILSMVMPSAEIRVDHKRISLNLGRRPYGDLSAKIEYGDPVADAHHEPNLVLHQQAWHPASSYFCTCIH